MPNAAGRTARASRTASVGLGGWLSRHGSGVRTGRKPRSANRQAGTRQLNARRRGAVRSKPRP